MKKIFNYQKFNNETLDGIVETFCALSDAYMEGKADTKEYRDANAALNETFMKFCVESIPNATFTSIEDVKNPMVHQNYAFTTAFDTVLARVLTPVIPTVIARGYEQLMDVVQVGWGSLTLRPAC